MPVSGVQCLTEQSPTPGVDLPALWKASDPKGGVRKETYREWSVPSHGFQTRNGSESLILDSSCASRGTCCWWLYWSSRSRQASLVQNYIHGEVQAKKKMPKRVKVAQCYNNIAARFKFTSIWLDVPITSVTEVSRSSFAPEVPQMLAWPCVRLTQCCWVLRTIKGMCPTETGISVHLWVNCVQRTVTERRKAVLRGQVW